MGRFEACDTYGVMTHDERLAHFRRPQFEDELASQARRIRELLERSVDARLDVDTFVEIAGIREDVEAAFLSLEIANDDVTLQRLQCWRETFLTGGELSRRLLHALEAVEFADPQAELARQVETERLRDLDTRDGTLSDEVVDEALAGATAVVAAIAGERRDLLVRLGVQPGVTPDDVIFLALVRRLDSPQTRTKLRAAWDVISERRIVEYVAAVDGVIDAQRARSRAAGFSTLLSEAMRSSLLSARDVEGLLDEHLAMALMDNERLIREASPADSDDYSLSEIDEIIRRVSAGTSAPLFDLGECLDYAMYVMRAALGLEVAHQSSSNGRHELQLAAGDAVYGEIVLDLWHEGAEAPPPNRTMAIRNATRWRSIRRGSVSHVSCGFHRRGDREEITFQNAHSLFHELGHALNHALMAPDLPALSGLESLPPERRECFPLWFEKWVYHPAFAEHVRVGRVDPARLRRCRVAKALAMRRSRVQSAVIARLDLEVFRSNELSIAEAYERINRLFGLSRFCTLDSVLGNFIRPISLTQPGIDFSYVWGAAEACQVFGQPTSAVSAATLPLWWIDPHEPASRPQLEPLFRFYRSMSAGWSRLVPETEVSTDPVDHWDGVVME